MPPPLTIQEGKCYGCHIVRKYDANLKKCPGTTGSP